jgi:hypothetical protein
MFPYLTPLFPFEIGVIVTGLLLAPSEFYLPHVVILPGHVLPDALASLDNSIFYTVLFCIR